MYIYNKSQLSLLGLGSQVGHEHVAHFIGGLGEEVAHAVSANALADNVKVETVLSVYCT